MRLHRLAIAASVITALVASLAIAAAVSVGDEEAPRQSGVDPTAIPTVTPRAEVPPPPETLPTPAPSTPSIEPAVEVVKPGPQDFKTDETGKYFADGPKGCPWVESRRRTSADQKYEEVVLTTACDEDVQLRFNPETGESALSVVD